MDPLDPAWDHCDSVKGLRSTMICRYCHKKTGGGITGIKYHLAGLQGHDSACESVPEKVKARMARLLKDGPAKSNKRTQKRKKGANLTVAFLKARENSKKIKKDKVSARRSEDSKESNYSPRRPVTVTSSKRRIHTRSRKDNKHKLDTNMFESLMEDLWREVPEEKRKDFIYFDSLWFYSYQYELKSKDELRKNKILKWIKNKRVLSKKYVLVPIVCWDHWSLLILCHLGDTNRSPCMLLLDSLLDAGPKRLENDIRRFVSDIYKISGQKQDKSFVSDIPFLIPKVPQQTDDEECGIFVLYFMLQFMESCPDAISLDGYPYFLTEEWFTRKEFEKFAREIEPSSLEKKGKKPQQSSDNVDPPDEVHTSELVKNNSDSMESQVSSVLSIKSTELKAPQTETRHHIKKSKKAGATENFSANKDRGKDSENSDSWRQNKYRGGGMSSANSDNPPQCNSSKLNETDGTGPTSCSGRQGNAVIGRAKLVSLKKQNSSSSVDCITETQHTGQKLASLTEKHWQPFSQNSEPDPNISPLLKNSPVWQHIQTLEVFKQFPQLPHFRKLESYYQDEREGMAIGLMVTYVNVATSFDKLSFDDDVQVFEQKISCLDALEENGFNVSQLRSRMKELLQIKTDHTGNHRIRSELENQLAQKESANASVLLELDKVGSELMELRKRLNFLTEQKSKLALEGDRLSNLTSELQSEMPRLREEIINASKLRVSAGENFEKLIADPF